MKEVKKRTKHKRVKTHVWPSIDLTHSTEFPPAELPRLLRVPSKSETTSDPPKPPQVPKIHRRPTLKGTR